MDEERFEFVLDMIWRMREAVEELWPTYRPIIHFASSESKDGKVHEYVLIEKL